MAQNRENPPRAAGKVMVRVSRGGTDGGGSGEIDDSESMRSVSGSEPTVSRMESVAEWNESVIRGVETAPVLRAVQSVSEVAGRTTGGSSETPVRFQPSQSGLSSKSMLQVMPFAVLLPSIGDLGRLHEFAPILKARLKGLYALDEAELLDEEKSRAAEEGTLSQVEQWLNKTTEGEER